MIQLPCVLECRKCAEKVLTYIELELVPDSNYLIRLDLYNVIRPVGWVVASPDNCLCQACHQQENAS